MWRGSKQKRTWRTVLTDYIRQYEEIERKRMKKDRIEKAKCIWKVKSRVNGLLNCLVG